MKRQMILILSIAVMAALWLGGCNKSDDDDQNAAAMRALGAFTIGGTGGTGGDGGIGALLGYQTITNPINGIHAQGPASILSVGAFAMPTVGAPAGSRVIAADYTWQDADNGTIANGLVINGGVTVTVPDNLVAGGISAVVEGPIIIAGSIVRGANTNGTAVKVDLAAAPTTSTINNTILVSGNINVSGPDNAAGGVSGGNIYLNNHVYANSYSGIYIAASLISNGGSGTGAATNGGRGGSVKIIGNSNANIEIAGNILVNGGNGTDPGDGGNAGEILIMNDDSDLSFPLLAPLSSSLQEDPVSLNSAGSQNSGLSSISSAAAPPSSTTNLGQINLYNVNGVVAVGGNGVTSGGWGGGAYFTSRNGGWWLTAPFFQTGGSASDTAGVGGYGKYLEVRANTSGAAHPFKTDLIMLADKWGTGGNGGASGGVASNSLDVFYVNNGNIYLWGTFYDNGGQATGPGGIGGSGARFSMYVSNTAAAPETLWCVVKKVIANAGNGVATGGSGQDTTFGSYSGGTVYIVDNSLSRSAGTGATNGTDGSLVITGSPTVKYVGSMPGFFQLP